MFLRVIPSVRMPIGHAFFDYRLNEGTAHRGDVLLVPFRNRLIAALVADITPTSELEDRAIVLTQPKKILKLSDTVVDLCVEGARECFVSPPTMLNAWLRHVPKRLPDYEPHAPAKDVHWPKDKPRFAKHYVANRFIDPNGIVPTVMAEQANGRVLVVTPRQKRAEHLATKLACTALHADLADGAAWRAWTAFASEPHGVLVTTRIGAWLAAVADIVIVDEPENDDHKQDELTPRYDARRLVELAAQINPALRTVSVGTTPRLVDATDAALTPELNPILTTVPFQRGQWSAIESLTQPAYDRLAEAVLQNRPIRILHAITGVRGRLRCADCGWTLDCARCGSGMTRFENQARCLRCNFTAPLPDTCAKCGNAELNKSAIGTQSLSAVLAKQFPGADIKIFDLSDWMSQSVTPNAVFVVTNVSHIGGFAEDVRRRERLIIAFRQLAAQACVAKCDLIIQGPEELIQEIPSWLKPQGLKNALSAELADRRAFGFPPARILVKLIVSGDEEKSRQTKTQLDALTQNNGWSVRGPFNVEFRPKSREQRWIFHILPPNQAKKDEIVQALTPLAALGILDLDPIAFFS